MSPWLLLCCLCARCCVRYRLTAFVRSKLHQIRSQNIRHRGAYAVGPPSDLVFMKLSTLCARMLFYRETELDLRLGWSIMDDIARDYSYGNEMKSYQDAVRNFKSAYSGEYIHPNST